MGFTVPDAVVPIVKTTNCLLAPGEAELPTPPPAQACIRCGMCAEACPASLLPQQLFWFAQGKEFEKLEQHNLFDCIECGACSWVCPSNIPLVQYYRASKAEIVQLRRSTERSEQSRLRFEARQQRLEREEAEQEAKRAARKQAAEQRAQAAASGAQVMRTRSRRRSIAPRPRKPRNRPTPRATANERDKLEKAVVTIRAAAGNRHRQTGAGPGRGQRPGGCTATGRRQNPGQTRGGGTGLTGIMQARPIRSRIRVYPPIRRRRRSPGPWPHGPQDAAMSPREKARNQLENLRAAPGKDPGQAGGRPGQRARTRKSSRHWSPR